MKVLLAIFVLAVAVLSRLSISSDGSLASREAVIALPPDQCYQRLTDLANFPQWMIAVQTVGGSHIPIKPKVGQHFVITTDWGFLGTIDQDVHVIKADGKRNFAYDVENWIGTHVEAHVDQLGEKQCKVRLTVSSRVKNPLQKYLIHPFARLYYSNWLTHSLLNFQLRYS
ncbi:hypothetical protein CRM22_006972 [Opisthorchis felineus]|uniref:Coenzyme Q-binding protein COQ10 START domain-containing protein n=1 Tax=Opisthorchis felineus TaxID=147828 RepID=A0A4S2LIF5_OPIFE|nr:hypothetical protein CRM22_006972 [Opisthorchis felineus]